MKLALIARQHQPMSHDSCDSWMLLIAVAVHFARTSTAICSNGCLDLHNVNYTRHTRFAYIHVKHFESVTSANTHTHTHTAIGMQAHTFRPIEMSSNNSPGRSSSITQFLQTFSFTASSRHRVTSPPLDCGRDAASRRRIALVQRRTRCDTR